MNENNELSNLSVETMPTHILVLTKKGERVGEIELNGITYEAYSTRVMPAEHSKKGYIKAQNFQRTSA